MSQKPFLVFAGALALGIAAAAGCGGNVVVDDPGGGGGGGGGGTPTGATTTSTIFNPASYCSFVCGEAEINGCLAGGSVSECQEGCVQVFDQFPACEAELKAFYDCTVAGFSVDCSASPGECTAETEDFVFCAEGG